MCGQASTTTVRRNPSSHESNHEDDDDDDDDDTKFPAMECQRYPPVCIPNYDPQKEIHFYLDNDDWIDDDRANQDDTNGGKGLGLGMGLGLGVSIGRSLPWRGSERGGGGGGASHGTTRKRRLACTWVVANAHAPAHVDGHGYPTPYKKEEEEDRSSVDGLPHPRLRFVDRSVGVVVICHGHRSWRNQMLLANLATQLSLGRSERGGKKKTNPSTPNHNIHVNDNDNDNVNDNDNNNENHEETRWHTLRFDFSGNGHSTDRPLSLTDALGFETNYTELCAVVHFVTEVMKCRVDCVVGHSKGSAAVLQYASANVNVNVHRNVHVAVVNLAGMCTGPGRTACWQLEGTHCRILTIHGDADDVVSVGNAHRFHALLPHNHTLKIIHGADHNFNGLKYIHDLVSTISDFIRFVHAMGTKQKKRENTQDKKVTFCSPP